MILTAVPDAAETGLIDPPPDRAEQMAAQAGRRPGRTDPRGRYRQHRPDQMRGATSPRLLLELMCAQVLLPAAATDEKSLLARLERLESAGRGTLAPVAAAPPRPPRPAPENSAERPSAPAPAERDIAAPAKPAASAEPARAPPMPAKPAAAAEPPAPASVPPASVPAATRPAAAPALGLPAADALGKNWDVVVEAVRQESRVAWMLLHNASVVSLEDGILTLRFPKEGEMKGFSVSGHDAVLKRVLSADFGLDVTVRGVTGADAGDRQARSAAAPARARLRKPRPGPGRAPASPRRPRIPPDETDDAPPDEPDVDSVPRGSELTGMDLIQRELGGQVIGEIED